MLLRSQVEDAEATQRGPRTNHNSSEAKALQLALNDVSVNYGSTRAVANVNLSLKPGEIGCLLGPSGCGKSTLLRAIAGFESLAMGEIVMHGRVLSSPQQQTPPELRRIGMVFQDIALFPHMTVAQNVAFGLGHLNSVERQSRIDELLSLIGLPDSHERYPASLSGGQQQRVALARALAPKPDLLLLDEPFSGLDATLKETLVPDVREILLNEQITALMVTHDQIEAFAIADRVAVMQQGNIEQFDTPYAIYHAPLTRFVADFVGQGCFLPAVAKTETSLLTGFGPIATDKPHGLPLGISVDLLLRPDDLIHDEDSILRAKVIKRQFQGTSFQYEVEMANGQRLLCVASSHDPQRVGSEIGIRFELDHIICFERLRD
ncbi:ABC transporter ATP-binding protein [Corallincola platygyrae]|uniref:ABC transporter ATP-binding protein n=1 Tax=Corallincola platygyrae TaxID=1193278 RepID=A0ABW4XQI7_9GAMM